MNTHIYSLYECIWLWFDDIAYLSTSPRQVGALTFDWPCGRARMIVAWGLVVSRHLVNT